MNGDRDEFRSLKRVIEILRGPQGCPWDREQTLRDVVRYLLEEASEAADAVAEADGEAAPTVCEELGDALMNILLASRIAEEQGSFSIEDVMRTIREKLIRRHPHVFGDAKVSAVSDVLDRWEEIKEDERAAGEKSGESTFRSRLAGVPRNLPPLARAYKVSSKAARSGFDWPDAAGSLEKLQEEVNEVRKLLGETSSTAEEARSRVRQELGDVLFAAVNLCRKVGVHPDEALRSTMKKFAERFEYMERRLPNLEDATLEEMDKLWDEVRYSSDSSASPDPRA